MLSDRKRVVNIDETWLPHLDFRRFKWGAKGERNTHAAKDLTHRVNLIASLDTDGRVYTALTQVNTDSEVIIAYLSKLVSVLAQEDKDFRVNTVFVLDGAAYHKSADTRAHLKKLGVSYLITGPYSFDASPIERFFAYFKQE